MTQKSIMVVDDSPTELRHLSSKLEERGFKVITATDGEEALEKAMKEHPPLIVLDIILPKKNGFQVCRQLKTSPATKDIKIIMLSSKSQESDRYWGLQQGADEYMCKPVDSDELFSNIAKFV